MSVDWVPDLREKNERRFDEGEKEKSNQLGEKSRVSLERENDDERDRNNDVTMIQIEDLTEEERRNRRGKR